MASQPSTCPSTPPPLIATIPQANQHQDLRHYHHTATGTWRKNTGSMKPNDWLVFAEDEDAEDVAVGRPRDQDADEDPHDCNDGKPTEFTKRENSQR